MQLAKFLSVVILILGLTWKYGPNAVRAFPVKYVRTEGVFQYLSKDEIKLTLEPLVKNGFFEADVQAIHNAVAAMPWVDSVAVNRIWPNTIDIKVQERKAYVRWGEKSLITEQAVIFTPKDIKPFQSLMMLTGPEQQQLKALEIMKGVKAALEDQALEIDEFSINDRWAWKIKMATGQEILLGDNEQLKKLQRFLKSLSVLKQEQVQAMAVIDLRYPNGFAVSWKPGMEEIDWKAMATPK